VVVEGVAVIRKRERERQLSLQVGDRAIQDSEWVQLSVMSGVHLSHDFRDAAAAEAQLVSERCCQRYLRYEEGCTKQLR